MNNKINKKTKSSLIIFMSFFALFVFSSVALAATAKLNWAANTESDLAGYKIYSGTSPRTGTKPSDPNNGGYTNVVDAGKVTTYTINNIADTGTTYFSITAYDNASPKNESAFSLQVSKTPGDVDKNGKVDLYDYNILKENFGKTSVCGNTADIDVDCDVDLYDYNTLKGNFGYQRV
jgi:hypothetical protein